MQSEPVFNYRINLFPFNFFYNVDYNENFDVFLFHSTFGLAIIICWNFYVWPLEVPEFFSSLKIANKYMKIY